MGMNKLVLLLLSVFAILPALAQSGNGSTEPEVETLFGSSEFTSGGYGGPELKLTSIDKGEFGLLVGGRGGWIINSVFSVGGGGYGLVTSHEVEGYRVSEPRIKEVYLRAGWGGLFIEYINNSNEVVHFTINALIGGGGAAYTASIDEIIDDENDDLSDKTYESSGFFLAEPGITADVNFTRFFRVSIGASYRIVSFLDLSQHESSDLGGPSFNICFKFGSF